MPRKIALQVRGDDTAFMRTRRLIASLAKLLVLIIALVGIYSYWRLRQPQDVIDDAADDLLEEVGTTYVAVHSTTISQGTLRRSVTAYGRVEPAPASTTQPAASASISSPVAARVLEVRCTEGEHVSVGQPLFTLDSKLAESLLAVDQASLKNATDRHAKFSADSATPPWMLLQAGREIDLATAAVARDQAELAALTISAPLAGVITRLSISPGATVDPARPAVEIVDPTRMVIALDVPADVLPQIHPGDEASSDFIGKASVNRVDAAIDPQSGMGSVDVAIPIDSHLRTGQAQVVHIVVETRRDCLIVPVASVTTDDAAHESIATIDADGRWANLVTVRTGIRDGDRIEIVGDGLKPGQNIVAVGVYGLANHTRIHLLRD